MKIRNRKLVSGIIATFMAVLMTGVVFAFAAQGPLTFTGTANVDASLALAIVESDFVGTGTIGDSGLVLSERVVATNGEGFRAAAMSAYFDGLEQSAVFSFVVENIGTITAEIAPIVLTYAPDSSERLEWIHTGALETLGAILQPGEYVEFSFEVAFDTSGDIGWYYIGQSGVSFVLSYGLVGSYPPAPPAPVAVADINLILTGIVGGLSVIDETPVERTWTNVATRGWEIANNWNTRGGQYTGNQNSWHRGDLATGRPFTVYSPDARLNALRTASVTPGNIDTRSVEYDLAITLENGEVITMVGRAYVVGPVNSAATFSVLSDCGGFSLQVRFGGGTFAQQWWLQDLRQ